MPVSEINLFRRVVLLIISTGMVIESGCAHVYPNAEIQSGDLKARIFLPDEENGYYRGTCFDWSGIISQVEYKGHTFFDNLEEPHNSLLHYQCIGLCEEFGTDMPLGFQTAKTDENFIKIGVGYLIKKDMRRKYFSGDAYEVALFLPWEVKKEENRISFRQTLQNARGWSYEYEKTIELSQYPPSMIVRHTLRNTGEKLIVTDYYCHNMILIDGKTLGTEYKIEFPFIIETAQKSEMKKRGAVLNGGTITFKELEGILWCKFNGIFGREQNNFKIIKGDVSMEVSGDWPVSKFTFYAEKSSICPEPYLSIRIAAGEEFVWNTKYIFSVQPH